jgi:hypothetical protein
MNEIICDKCFKKFTINYMNFHKNKCMVVKSNRNMFCRLPIECLNIINDYLKLKDNFTTYKRFFLNNLNVALVCKYLYNIFIIKTKNFIKLSIEEEKKTVELKIAKKEYGIKNKDIIKYNLDKNELFLTNIMDIARIKYGSYYSFLHNKDKIKKKKIIHKNNLITRKNNYDDLFEKYYTSNIGMNKYNEFYDYIKTGKPSLLIIENDIVHNIEINNYEEKKNRDKLLRDIIITYNLKINNIKSNITPLYDEYLKYGYLNNDDDDDIGQVINSVIKRNERELILKNKLLEFDLYLSNYKNLTNNYLYKNTGNIDDVINTIREYNFYNRYTNYLEMYFKEKEENFIVDEDEIKLKAINEWIKQNKDFKNLSYVPNSIYNIVNNIVIKKNI